MDLVSLISPTYNCAECLPYFLDSIINQTYDRIQLVIVDDGSTDNTGSVLDSYIGRFHSRGYEMIVLHQPNLGQAAAINHALGHFSGDFLMWIDSDDMIEPECITEMVEWLKQNPDKDFVLCDARHVNYPDFSTKYLFSRKLDGKKDPYFYDILKGTHNYTLGNGSLLVRSERFRSTHPQMKIYESRQGQNYQLILPLVYFCSWGYIHKPFYIRVQRPDSHFYMKRSYEEELTRQSDCAVLMKETIRMMHIPDEKKAFQLIENRFAHRSFELAFDKGDNAEMKKQLKILFLNRGLTLNEIVQFLRKSSK